MLWTTNSYIKYCYGKTAKKTQYDIKRIYSKSISEKNIKNIWLKLEDEMAYNGY